jgi:hypothetical protein
LRRGVRGRRGEEGMILKQQTTNKKQETRNKKQETRNKKHAPCPIPLFLKTINH